MSNDLISRKVVIELIESKIVDGVLCKGEEHPLIDANKLMDDISDIPISYDVDKVLIKLESQKETKRGRMWV